MTIEELFRVARLSDVELLELSRDGVREPYAGWEASYQAVVSDGCPLACVEVGQSDEAAALATIARNPSLEVYPSERELFYFRRVDRAEALNRIAVLRWFPYSPVFSQAWEYVHRVLLGDSDADIALFLTSKAQEMLRHSRRGARLACKNLMTCADGSAELTVELLDHAAWLVRNPVSLLEEEREMRFDGSEPMAGTTASVQDFWKWAFSEVTTDERVQELATFIVARRLGTEGSRITHRVDVDGQRLRVLTGRGPSRENPKGDKVSLYFPLQRADLDAFIVAHPRIVDPAALFQGDTWEFKVVPTSSAYLAGRRTLAVWEMVPGDVVSLDELPSAVKRVREAL